MLGAQKKKAQQKAKQERKPKVDKKYKDDRQAGNPNEPDEGYSAAGDVFTEMPLGEMTAGPPRTFEALFSQIQKEEEEHSDESEESAPEHDEEISAAGMPKMPGI